MMTKRFRVVFLLCLLIWGGVFTSFFVQRKEDDRTIVIGAKSQTEQLIVAEMIALLLEKETQLKVKRLYHLDGTLICFEALRSGDIDLYCEYTGTALMHILRRPYLAYSKEEMFRIVSEEFLKRFECVWMPPLGFDNQYVVIMDETRAKKGGIRTLSDLKKGTYRFAFDPEFSRSPELKLIEERYNLRNMDSRLMEKMLAFLSLTKGGIDATIAYSTDGVLSRFPVRVLEDDLHVLPPYDTAPVVRNEVLKLHPEIEKTIYRLRGILSNEQIRLLNDRVEIQKETYKEVAKCFLKKVNLI